MDTKQSHTGIGWVEVAPKSTPTTHTRAANQQHTALAPHPVGVGNLPHSPSPGSHTRRSHIQEEEGQPGPVEDLDEADNHEVSQPILESGGLGLGH